MVADLSRDSLFTSDPKARRADRSENENGFSIIELMIALLVLLFGFMAMANLIATSIVVNRFSNRLTSLTQLASEKLEELRSLDPNDPRLHDGGSLTTNMTSTVVDGAGSHTVPYFDAVFVNQRDGSVTTISPPSDTPGYSSVTRTLAGTTVASTSSSEPTQVGYRRRWLIESNQPITGATQITVEVAVKTGKLSDPDLPSTANNYWQVIRMRAVR